MDAHASGPFYATDTFWAAAGVVVAVLGGWGAIWAAFRVSHPRRRLTYAVTHARLVRRRIDGSLEIRRNGTLLADPHLVTVVLTNRGRRDIASSAFDRGEPFRVSLGVPYAEILAGECLPSAALAPPARIHGTELRIGPGRIGSGTTITYQLLVDREPSYSCRHSLLDVRVQSAPAPPLQWGRTSSRSSQRARSAIS
ncbi:hypothetical protein [Streptomyces cylindrosporus]|uniref:DUF58 domain-containing protein n=1 Tax=Streptomyces cylindrosporus TaxID=2927583 RepID=A0ABS9YLF0_9ACTN|nr:hypothetical protein [Streptomyces cylindrosporus]MCI3278092.1 hypothetical protein [Streptomyces cylindrosporus]